jgi:signal transduction histidine kinase
MSTVLDGGSAPPCLLDSDAGESRGHAVHFYVEDSTLLDTISQCIGAALKAGDSAIIIATSSHHTGLTERLESQGLNMAAITGDGRCRVLDAETTLAALMSEGWPDSACFAKTIGSVIERARTAASGKNKRVIAFGEMVALLWARGQYGAALQLERYWNDLLRERCLSLHCAYPMTAFKSQEHSREFLQICSEHSQVVPDETYPAAGTKQDRRRNVAVLQQKAQVLEAEMAERQGLRDLSTRLLHVQDDERRRVARDLHDNTGQQLALLSMSLYDLETKASRHSPDLAEGLANAGQLVRQVSAELRTLSYLLHPPLLDEMGLESALRWYVDGFTQRSGVQVTLDVSADLGRLSNDSEISMFRVVEECLTNIHRHSGSSTARIRIYRLPGKACLQVSDEGQGIARERLSEIEFFRGAGLGLRGIRERVAGLNGELEVVSREKGTEITVVIPCADQRCDPGLLPG